MSVDLFIYVFTVIAEMTGVPLKNYMKHVSLRAIPCVLSRCCCFHIFPLLVVPVKSVGNLNYSLVYFTLCCSIILYIVVFIFLVT